jgi:hypothetical protein
MVCDHCGRMREEVHSHYDPSFDDRPGYLLMSLEREKNYQCHSLSFERRTRIAASF